MITKKKSNNPILAWIQNEDNMNVVYGLGAAVVILGALFKLQGWPGANPMLIVGLGVEAVISVDLLAVAVEAILRRFFALHLDRKALDHKLLLLCLLAGVNDVEDEIGEFGV